MYVSHFHPGAIVVTSCEPSSATTFRSGDTQAARAPFLFPGLENPPTSKNICRQGYLLRTATTIVADRNCSGEDPKIRRSESDCDGARLSCSHARATGVRLGIIDTRRPRDHDAGNVQCGAPGIGQCRCLGWRAAAAPFAEEVQAGWDELHNRARAIQRHCLPIAGRVICNGQRPGSWSSLRGFEGHVDRAGRSGREA